MPPKPDDENEISEEGMTKLATQLKMMAEAARLDHALKVGDVVLASLFGGDAETFEQTRKGHRLFRALVGKWRGEVGFLFEPVPRTKFQQMVRIAAQYRRFPDDLRQGLSVRHHAVLLAGRDLADRVDLGRAALAAGWSPAELRSRIPRDEEAARIQRRRRRLAIRMRRIERAMASPPSETKEEFLLRFHATWWPTHLEVARRGLERLREREAAWMARRPQD
jgi:hypothetical protein